MMWDIAGGVIIAGGVLAIIAQGIGFYTYSAKVPDAFKPLCKAAGVMLGLLGLAAAIWIIFYKANQI